MSSKPFPFSVCKECCGTGDIPGGITEEQIEEIKKEIIEGLGETFATKEELENGDVQVGSAYYATEATFAQEADNAECDADGNIIHETYLRKGAFNGASNAPVKKASGDGILRIDDVCPVTHIINVKAGGPDSSVTCYGKNLISPIRDGFSSQGYIVNRGSLSEIFEEVVDDGAVRVSGKSTVDGSLSLQLTSGIDIYPWCVFTISWKSDNNTNGSIYLTDINGNAQILTVSEESPLTISGGDYSNINKICAEDSSNTIGSTSLRGTYYIQVEAGEEFTGFTKYEGVSSAPEFWVSPSEAEDVYSFPYTMTFIGYDMEYNEETCVHDILVPYYINVEYNQELDSHLNETFGDIDAALDRIIEIQNTLIGGGSE